MTTRPTQSAKPSPADVARAFLAGRTTKDVLRAMAEEPKCDLRIKLLVERIERAEARKAAKEAAAADA